jgi:hypothetical protein
MTDSASSTPSVQTRSFDLTQYSAVNHQRRHLRRTIIAAIAGLSIGGYAVASFLTVRAVSSAGLLIAVFSGGLLAFALYLLVDIFGRF